MATKAKGKAPPKVVQDMVSLINSGRFSERMEIMDELKGWLDGGRGWGGKGVSAEDRAPLEAFLQWLEARDRAHTARVNA